jgi:hypothetical protein
MDATEGLVEEIGVGSQQSAVKRREIVEYLAAQRNLRL